jgi:hypothetical protein
MQNSIKLSARKEIALKQELGFYILNSLLYDLN